MLPESVIILVLVLANGLFAGAEIAVIALRKTRLQELVEARRSGARAVAALRAQPERFLATVQVGITVISTAASAFGGASVAATLAGLLAHVPRLAPYAHQLALALVVAGVSYLSLVLGELVPKSLALRSAESYALLAGRPLLALAWLVRPLVWFLTASSNVVLKLFRDQTSFTEARLSREEIQQMVDEAAQVGTVDALTGEIASRALDLDRLTASAVMVPASEITALPCNASTTQLAAALHGRPHARMPVYEGSPDNVVGYVSLKDVVLAALAREEITLRSLLRSIHVVPETMRAVDVLRDLRRLRSPIAIVVDERGGLAGLVTMEDLVEEVVGDMFSEHEPPADWVQREAAGRAVVPGNAAVHDVNRALGLALPEGRQWNTVAGLYLALAGHIPRAGERVTTEDGTVLEVVDATPRRIRALRIIAPEAKGAEGKEKGPEA